MDTLSLHKTPIADGEITLCLIDTSLKEQKHKARFEIVFDPQLKFY